MAWALVYAAAFFGGPCIVLVLLRGQSDEATVRRLGAVTVALVMLGMALAMFGPPGSVALVVLWAAWVASMAVMGHVLRLVVIEPGARRWTAALAAVGATLPWFGLLVARSVMG